MEGSAKGHASARAPDSATSITGVIVPTLFPHRTDGNPYLTSIVRSPTLLSRIEAMISVATHFVVLPGTLGTLTEAAVVWNLAALGPMAGVAAPCILVYEEPWKPILTGIETALNVPEEHRNLLRFVRGCDDVIAAVREDVDRKREAARAAGK